MQFRKWLKSDNVVRNKHIEKIDIFDFDDTLVLVPSEDEARTLLHKYNLWADANNKPLAKKWTGLYWDHAASLKPPIFMDPAPTSMLNKEVISKFYESKRDKKRHTVIMTGRPDTLHNELNRILKDLNLVPDELIMVDIVGETMSLKLKALDKLLKEHPHVKEIEMWDDRGSKKAQLTGNPEENHVKAFKDFLTKENNARQNKDRAYFLKFKVNEIPVREDRVEELKRLNKKKD